MRVLVREAYRMAEFVRCGAAVEKPEVHRRLARRYPLAIGAYVGPRAVAGGECNAALGVGRIVEIELEVGDSSPPAGLLARDRLLRRRAGKESHAQRRSVHPR